MSKFQVTVVRSIEIQVEVEADDAKEALETVDSADFELPPRDLWQGHDDWFLTVSDADGRELLNSDGDML
jgi:hypothetical protein